MTTYNASTMPNVVNRFPNSLRAMPIKVVYTLNDNIHQFFLARHTPIAVRLVKKAEPTRRQRQKTAKQLKKGSGTPASTPTRSTPTRRSQMGAESKGDVINVDDMPEQPAEEDAEETEYGFAPLKVCVKAVWAASPDLAYDRSREWSIYCLDPMEQSGGNVSSSDGVASKFSGVMTGMGLVSHALQEDDRTLSPVSVTGRIIDDQGGEALEVILQMKSTMAPSAMLNPYAAWPQHQMMYGYPQHPSFYRAAAASMLAAQQRIPPPPPAPARAKSSTASASTPAPSDAPTPELSAATPYTASSQETISTIRSSSVEPTRKTIPKPFTQQPLTRGPPKPKKPPKPSRSTSATPADIFVSLATRLNSVDGGTEPPAPDTEEGQLLDCMVAWLKTAAGARLASEIGMGAVTPAASQSTDGSTPAEAIEIPASPPPAKVSSSQSSAPASSPTTISQRYPGLQSKSQPAASTSTSSQTKSGRVVLGNKPNAVPTKPRVVSGGKPVGKSMNRSVSGSHGTRKRALDDEDYGPNKKRQKTGRSVSGASTGSSSQPILGVAKLSATVETVRGKGVIEFPKTSDILGIKFAPQRAYNTNLDNSPEDEATVRKKHPPEPETPRPKTNANNRSSTGFELTSPFVGGEADGGDDSLFSEAGTPAVMRNLSPFRPMGRRRDVDDRMTDGITPSSPCERRTTTGGAIRIPVPHSPIRMLGQGSNKSPSSSEPRTPRPRWAADLPPSSPPPPSSPIATDSSLTPADPGDVDDEVEAHEEGKRLQEREDGPNVNESPSKFFARYFSFDRKSDDEDLAASLLETATEPGTGTVTPSEVESEAGYGMGFNFNLDDLHIENLEGSSRIVSFGSSSEFSLDDFGWSEGAAGNTQGDSSDGEQDAAGASSDLDFDVNELWSWMQQNGASQLAASAANAVNAANKSTPPVQSDTASSEGSVLKEGDSLRNLLGGCVV